MAKPDNSPAHHAINSLILALFIAAIPHFIYQPFWVSLMFVVMISWRLLHTYRGWPLPAASRWLKVLHNGTAAIMILLIFGYFGISLGRDAGAALLTVMLAFKVVEIRSLRDYYLTCYLGLFLVITNFFFSQSMLMVVLMLLVVVLLASCLISVNSADSAQNFKQRVLLSGKMVLQAIPVMLFLFVLFPRISGPFWSLPQDAGAVTTTSMTEQITLGELPTDQSTGTSGISDNIQMGKISQLILSDEIAFRVEFDNDAPPPPSQLYWRGPVLWNTDGTVWSPLARGETLRKEPEVDVRGEGFSYTMTMEPHNKKWLFALDFPTTQPENMDTYLSTDGRLNSLKSVKQRSQYSLVSHPEYQFNPDSDPNLPAALQLPAGKHPRTMRLAEKWSTEVDTPQQYISRVLSHFNQEKFVYTLAPPVLSGDTVDGFLFETRRGFCEHYAASFTVLMRAAGIPARIVTGYQGGDINPVDQVMTIRQRDAHAWSEVWLPEQGWVRVDPTSAVSSDRIERGMSNLLPASRKSPGLIARNDALVEAWQTMKNNWDALNTTWDIWVVGFGPELQVELLSKLGMTNPDWRKMAAVLAILLGITGLIMLVMSYYRKAHPEPGVELYRAYCQKLARLGIEKQAYEGPRDYALRAQKQLPDYRRQIQFITDLYTRLRYRLADDGLLKELKQQVKQFRPKR